MLKDLLESKKCFKLVCAAGNEDVLDVEKLVSLYSKAGCKFFDLCAKPEVVLAAKNGLKNNEGYLCVSVGTKNDPHIRKAQISDKCTKCGKCINICPQNAIYKKAQSNSDVEQQSRLGYCSTPSPPEGLCRQNRLIIDSGEVGLEWGDTKFTQQQKAENLIAPQYNIDTKKCIGCAKCAEICQNDAINFNNKAQNLKEILPPLIELGIDCIELHASFEDEIYENWNYINDNFNGILSICINSEHIGQEKFLEILKKMLAVRKPYTTIIKAEGASMTGNVDDINTTIQTIEIAKNLQKENLNAYIMLSGGTNIKSTELAKEMGAAIDGVAIGTYARKIVSEFTKRDDFLTNEAIFNEALKIAQELVDSSTK